MTIEQLLGFSADVAEKLTDAELNEHFAKYLPATRPDLAAIKHKESKKKENDLFSGTNKLKHVPSNPEVLKKKLMAKEIAAKYGIKIKGL